MTKANFDTSEGWILIDPILIHRKLPFTSVPTPGKNKAINKIKEHIKIIQSNEKNKFEGILKAKIVAKIPIVKKIICLDAKWKGVP